VVDHTSQPWKSELDEDSVIHTPILGNDLDADMRIPECPCARCTTVRNDSEILHRRLAFDEYDDIDLMERTHITDHQYFLCFSHVYAYALRDRTWGKPHFLDCYLVYTLIIRADLLDVLGLKPPVIDKTVIDTLVMRPESNKEMIKAICETHGQKGDRDALFFADYIKGKGEGQILLLHGPPGTGKTLTAGMN
jgi:hypothetical protein